MTLVCWRLGPIGVWTDRVDLEAMTDRAPSEFPADSIAQGDQFFVLELDQPTRLHADHVIARLTAVDQLKVRLLRVEQGLHDDPGVLEQMDGSVQRCLRHALTATTKFEQELFRLKDTIASDDGVENIRALVRVLQAAGLEVATEH